MKELFEDGRKRMQKSLKAFKEEMARVRTGRASVSLLEGIKVDYYGTKMPIPQMATVTVQEGRYIVIQPWDVSTVKAIEKAIMESDLGLTPTSDGKIIRITVPPLTEERRRDLVKLVRKMAEEARVAIRNIRRELMDELKRMKKEGEISEDDFHRFQDQVQKLTDEFIGKIEEVLEEKEKEILTV
ncbi:ribosome recycling factor [Thermosulfurimonas sp. F29]|uniref:ribosome recycling factor n=1 Tax=Thermosulfurimonas sp. F29 TaxID=2867247 RepID=UPI001C83D0ED|nr:ribosome recycling factor [Thermosulfurimonas sp. F29]MBX6423490.1 ribosome recycling factor [Thermosulfurimonas sp. F29]